MICSFMETCPIPPKTRVNLALSLHPLQPIARLVWNLLLVLVHPLQNHLWSLHCMFLVQRIRGNVHQQPRSKRTSILKSPDLVARCPLQKEWQTAGNRAASDFLSTGPIRQSLITKIKGEIENLIPRIMKAADDFRDMFPNFFDSDSSLSIKLRNEERHLRLASLQLEFMIPTRAQGRRFDSASTMERS